MVIPLKYQIKLYCLSSGCSVDDDAIKKMKLKTMDTSSAKVTLTTSDKKKVSNRQVLYLTYLSNCRNLAQMFWILRVFVSYPLTPVIYSIGTVNGFLAKTNKSKGFQWLTKNISLP